MTAKSQLLRSQLAEQTVPVQVQIAMNEMVKVEHVLNGTVF
jgi:hypothetical protein